MSVIYTVDEIVTAIKGIAGPQHSDGMGIEVDLNPIRITLTFKDATRHGFAGFTLAEMPGNCGMLVSTQTWVDIPSRGRGHAQAMMRLKIAIAKSLGYSVLQATVLAGNFTEKHILEKFGWSQAFGFNNTGRTGNDVEVWLLDVASVGQQAPTRA